MCLVNLLGIAGIYARQVEEAGRLGLAGFLLFCLMWALTAPFQFAEAFVLPLFATDAPELVEGFVGISSESTGDANLGALPTAYALTGRIFAVPVGLALVWLGYALWSERVPASGRTHRGAEPAVSGTVVTTSEGKA
jgi:hypothetical protein